MKELLPLALIAALLASCAPIDSSGGGSGTGYLSGFNRAPTPEDTAPLHARGYWDGEGVEGPPSIVIKRDEQKAYFYKGSHLVGMSPIATGKTTHTTPAGKFKVTQKSPDHTSSLYGVIRDTRTGQIVNDDADTRKDKPGPGQVYEGAPMPYFLRFNGGVGMHVGHLPGYAASHGCVRMPEPMAKKFYENSPIGTPVTVL
ncbi:MAG: L,D-transpeptidase family protein [Verrucomicrobiaceae bacterium]